MLRTRSSIGAALGLAALTACGLGSLGTAPEEAGTGDAGSDVTVADTGSRDAGMDVAETGSDASQDVDAADGSPDACSGVLCNGACVGSCQSCPGAHVLCKTTGKCAGDCAGCVDRPIECFSCDMNHQNPLGTCEPADDASVYCLSGAYAGTYVDGGAGYHCACDDAGECPGATEVCGAELGIGAFCLTCGERTYVSMQDAKCSGGGACDVPSLSCR